jgi:hypothetical protein
MGIFVLSTSIQMELFGISDEPSQQDSIPFFVGFAKLCQAIS